MRTRSHALARALLLGVATPAFAGFCEGAVLGSMNASDGGLVLGRGVLGPELNLRFTLSDSQGPCWIPSPPSCYVLLDQRLTPADIGKTFAITGASNADFGGAAASLTDGAENLWGFSIFPTPGGAIGIPVSQFFPNGGGPDFRGYTISEVDLTIDNLLFYQVNLPTGWDTFGVFTVVQPSVTITVQGSAVPEPDTRALLLVAAVIFAYTRRQHVE